MKDAASAEVVDGESKPEEERESLVDALGALDEPDSEERGGRR